MAQWIDWAPKVPQDSAPLYERVIRALSADIASGRLRGGERLPPQRELAHATGIGLGTITRVYTEAERMGLVDSHVGRGTFVATPVAGRAANDGDPLDLAQNVPPYGYVSSLFAGAFAKFQKRADLREQVRYAPPAGADRERQLAQDWLRWSSGFETVDWSRLTLTAGAQQSLAMVFGLLCRPGDIVLCEAATFHGAKALAAHLGLRLRGVAMDDEGVDPAALEEAAAESRASVVYLMPTLQNPTGRVMSARRRAAIARVVERVGLWIVEDDTYSAYLDHSQVDAPSLAAVCPDRTFYVSSMSKSVAPGLRTGFLAAPTPEFHDKILLVVRATSYAPPSFGAAMSAQLIEDGHAQRVVEENRKEAGRRTTLARDILGQAIETRAETSLHLWLPMAELEAERLAGRALRAGAEVTPPSAPIVDGALISGVRLCLGAAPDLPALGAGLRTVARALHNEANAPARSVL